MKFVINTCFGGFDFPKDFHSSNYSYDDFIYSDNKYNYRTDKDLINYVETHICNFYGTNLQVVEIPDEATDYRITDYDGYEDIIYVLNGKIHILLEDS